MTQYSLCGPFQHVACEKGSIVFWLKQFWWLGWNRGQRRGQGQEQKAGQGQGHGKDGSFNDVYKAAWLLFPSHQGATLRAWRGAGAGDEWGQSQAQGHGQSGGFDDASGGVLLLLPHSFREQGAEQLLCAGTGFARPTPS